MTGVCLLEPDSAPTAAALAIAAGHAPADGLNVNLCVNATAIAAMRAWTACQLAFGFAARGETCQAVRMQVQIVDIAATAPRQLRRVLESSAQALAWRLQHKLPTHLPLDPEPDFAA